MKKTKSSGVLFSILWAVICFGVSAALFGIGGHRIFSITGETTQFDEVPLGELEGEYVELRIPASVEEYAYTSPTPESEHISSKEFVVSTPDQLHYMGVLVKDIDFEDYAAPLESMAFDQYPVTDEVVVRGTVYAMDEETKGYFDEALEFHGISDKMALHSYLKVNDVGGFSATGIWILCICSLVLLPAAIVMIFVAIRLNRK